MIHAQYSEIDGASAYVEQAGAGTPVLCLHTAGQSGVQWRHVIRELAELGYRAVVPDLPGHGRSEPAPSGPVRDLSVYADWCRSLIGALDLQRPYVVGCSIGGKIALDLAARAGSALSGVVAMAADAHNGNVSLRGLERELEDAAAPSRTDRTYYGTLASVGRSVPARQAELIATMHRREDPAVSTSDLIGWGSHDLRAALPAIACPAHLVVGEDDPWLDSEAVRWAAAQIPGACCTVLEGIGHYPMEELDGFAHVLHGWLAELGESVPREAVRP
ncbi:pimeloyl-ACP methyl ester carboxylesterase [Halopolyspora algeriensis]|uniref:Pimeloyl-ACP methyl ester carboxylesterase n=1 Tax=Halopolyspora algeriensis TaxID=1500506 RepID=A0A368VWL8_9ACTN|nr:alpha/beta hydrolase [Halopolyspora algeriensis]RCW45760.1 pimeloyl-ACP methyl ester carboxylesterase [Halopolyspora algeriensis]TQM54144.1 pimeloyl-ACP methyl ester carboxylesterase [Halopolyspora algeriensis]